MSSLPHTTLLRGARTRVLLITSLVLVIVAVTVASLLAVRHRLSRQIVADLSADLTHSTRTFEDMEQQRLQELERRNALLADLPSLKAVMTTSDKQTIADAAVQFWRVSGNDLFALSDVQGHVITAYIAHTGTEVSLEADLQRAIQLPQQQYLLSGSHLYEYSVRPLFFGTQATGTLLGYVISGDAIDTHFLHQLSQAADVEAAFLEGHRVVVSTMPSLQDGSRFAVERPDRSTSSATEVTIAGEHFFYTTHQVSQMGTGPLQLVVMRSFSRAEGQVSEIDHLVVAVGISAIGAGIVLMLLISDLLTRPLEILAAGVRAFGTGEADHRLPENGTREVRELSVAFGRMRDQIQATNRALLEAERLATIGRMASSVSHDLRHYLAAVYANAEFLVSTGLSPRERNEIFDDIRTAVHGTTDMLDSLLIFSRSGPSVRRQHELMAALLERAIALARTHPDAQGITLSATYDDPIETEVLVDARQIERAIYNLLLNACQSRTPAGRTEHVHADLTTAADSITLLVTDDGPGVPEAVRERVFEPFVSQGKQKGTGLGLTLVSSIALEHGGDACLLSSRAGETIFRVRIMRSSGVLSTEQQMEAKKVKIQ